MVAILGPRTSVIGMERYAIVIYFTLSFMYWVLSPFPSYAASWGHMRVSLLN